ncbi:MAG: hypothetical protein AB7V25_09660 [Mangrovibacterium sp.]
MKIIFIFSIAIWTLVSCSDGPEVTRTDEEDPPVSPPSGGKTIIVKADDTWSVSGKNDIDVIRNYFYSGTLCNDNLTNDPGQALWNTELNYARGIGVHGMRSINGERGSNLDAAGNFMPHANLNAHLNVIHKHQWDLHLVVGQSKPAALSGDAWSWTGAQWDLYEDYAYKCLKYVMIDYAGGFPEALVEVENEVDIGGAQGRWFIDGGWSIGNLKGYYGYAKLYAQWSDAVKRFAQDYPGKKIRLLGPAITSNTIRGTALVPKENWALKFIDDARTNNWRVDGISFHQYGDKLQMLGQRPDYTNGEFPPFRSTVKNIRDKLDACGFSEAEIWITEWGANSWVGTERYKMNYRPTGGAFAAAFMHECLEIGIAGMVPLRLRDPNTDSDWSEIGSLATINKVIYPKPVFNVFRMFNQLPGDRKKVEWRKLHIQLGAIASASENKAGVLVYNYDWDDKAMIDRSEPHEVQVKIAARGVKGQITVKRYLMDQEYSNLAKYVDTDFLPPPVPACELQKVEEYTLQASQDTITLKPGTMGKSAVSLWLVSQETN